MPKPKRKAPGDAGAACCPALPLCHSESRAKPSADQPALSKGALPGVSTYLALYHLPLPPVLPPVPPSCEVRLVFQLQPCACFQGNNTPSKRGPETKLSTRVPLGFLGLPSLCLQDANLAHAPPVPHSYCPDLTPTLPPLSWWFGDEPGGRMREAPHVGLLSHLTLFHFFFL